MKRLTTPARRTAGRPSVTRVLREATIGRALTGARELRQAAGARSRAMVERDAEARRGTRKRALVPVAAGFVGLFAMFTAVSHSILAVNFTTGDRSFKIYSNYLDAQKAAAFLSPTTRRTGAQSINDCNGNIDSDQCGVAELGIVSAKLAGLCGIATENIPIINMPFSLMITAGDAVPDSYGDGSAVPKDSSGNALTAVDSSTGKLISSSLTNAISANNLFINSNLLGGYGNLISGLNLGMSATTVAGKAGLPTGASAPNGWPRDNGGTEPASGNFGLYAEQLNVAGLAGDSYGLNLAGAITLPKLSLKVVPGAKTQVDCS